MVVKFQGGMDDKLKAGALVRKLNSMGLISRHQDGVEIQFIGLKALYPRVMSQGYIPVAGKDYTIAPVGTFAANPVVGYDDEDDTDEDDTDEDDLDEDVTNSLVFYDDDRYPLYDEPYYVEDRYPHYVEVVDAAVSADAVAEDAGRKVTPLFEQKMTIAEKVAYDRLIAKGRRGFAHSIGSLYRSDTRFYVTRGTWPSFFSDDNIPF